MTRFILHIGPHKTGTTYIQETLAALRAPLRMRGVHVPSVWNATPMGPSHMRLVWAIRSNDLAPLEAHIRDIENQGYAYAAISCEALSRLTPAQIGRLRQLLGCSPAQVVYYTRRAPDRMPSLWQEMVKFGHAGMFLEFLIDQLTNFEESEFRDVRALDRYAAVFGAENIEIVSYDALEEARMDIAGHFLTRFLNVENLPLPPANRPNRSLPIVDTEAIRALNAIHARHGGEASPDLREWYLRHGHEAIPNTLYDAMRGHPGAIRIDERLSPFAPALTDLGIRYRASFVRPHRSSDLQPIDVPYIRPNYLLEAGISDILSGIYHLYPGRI